MLKEFVEYIRGLKGFDTVKIGEDTYSNKELIKVEPPEYHTREKMISTLDGLVRLVAIEAPNYGAVYIHVQDPLHVEAFTDTDKRKERDVLGKVEYIGPVFMEFPASPKDTALAVRGLCAPGEDRDYLLNVLNGVTVKHESNFRCSEDTILSDEDKTVCDVNGDPFKKEVFLKPNRTFPEVEQPESPFLLSVEERMIIVPRGVPRLSPFFACSCDTAASATGSAYSAPAPKPELKRSIVATLTCVDGGKWQLTAMERIREYLREKMDEYGGMSNVFVL